MVQTLHGTPLTVLPDLEVVRLQVACGIALAVRDQHLELNQLNVDLASVVGALQELRVLPLAAVGELRHYTDEIVGRSGFQQALHRDRARRVRSRFLVEVAQGLDQVLAPVELDPF